MGFDTPVAHAVNDKCIILNFFMKFSMFESKTTTLRLGSKAARLKLKGISCRVDRRWNIAVETKQRVKPYHSLYAIQFIVRFYYLKKQYIKIAHD